MAGITASNAHTLALFGIKAKNNTVATLVNQVQKAPAGAKAREKVSVDSGTRTASRDEEAKWAKAYAKSADRSIAEEEAYVFREETFARENGFRREVNEKLINVYNQIASGRFSGYNASTFDDAVDHVRDAIASMASPMRYASGILEITDEDAQVREANKGSRELEIALAEEKDHLDAAKMNMFIHAELFKKTFNYDTTVYAEDDGRYVFKKFEFQYGGRKFATMAEDQVLTVYNRDGSVAVTDDYSTYLRF